MQKKLLLFSALIVACMQANKQDPLADIKAFAKGALSASAGLVVGNVIGNKIGHPDAATVAGGLLGALADHCASGGKRNPHYWWSKAGNALPMVLAVEIIYLNHLLDRQAELIAKIDEIYADTDLVAQRNKHLSDLAVWSQLSYFVCKNMSDDWNKSYKANGGYQLPLPHQAKLEILPHVTKISASRLDGSRIARIGKHRIILRGPGAQNAYDLWKSLKPMPESIPLNLPANNTRYLSASVGADASIATYADVKEAVFVKLSKQGHPQENINRFDQEYPEQTQESTEILAFNCDSIEWNTANPACAKINVGNKRFVIQGDLARAFTSWHDRTHRQMVVQMYDDKEKYTCF